MMADDAASHSEETEKKETCCFICETAIVDPDLLGEMGKTTYCREGKPRMTIHCHYFCLLFSCNLQMRGKEDQGIRGFLPEDIIRERNRGRNLTCFFCNKSGPTSACCEKTCKIAYHLPCALYRKEELAKLVPENFFKEVS